MYFASTGSISYERACRLIKRLKEVNRADLLAAFKRIDINSDGFITENELYRVLTTVSDLVLNMNGVCNVYVKIKVKKMNMNSRVLILDT